MSKHEVTVVTGGNRGIGFEVCRQIARRGQRVVLTARRLADAERAAESLAKEGLDVDASQLDVTDEASLELFVASLSTRDLKVSVLVNNAAVSLRGFDASVAQRTLDVNFYGAVAVTDRLLPRMTPSGSIVMVSSGMGELSCLSPALRARFSSPTLDRAQLFELMCSFVADVARGEHVSRGWPTNAYSVSKVGLNAFTRVLARELRDSELKVNAVCPGWVRTRMGGAGAPKSVEEGAAGVVQAALFDAQGPRGVFLREGHAIAW